ncbi:hypothetical protein Cgig2_005694 [Carnegiea gigantea]|uniref:60S ribosomal export protein NMD3 n=1 Tax=Carnegiea gigantea TaxID=171969 RepID=A0A9Q1QHU8_9CARY|nr:hypothetical protein Cgig2_005694 [Carnegiea gigantea]
MATRDKKSARLQLLKWGCREKAISKTTKRRNPPRISTIDKRKLLLQSLNGVLSPSAMKEVRTPSTAIHISYFHLILWRFNGVYDLGSLMRFEIRKVLVREADPMTGLPKFMVINHCRNCAKYYDSSNCLAPTHSPELLNVLVKMLDRYFRRPSLVLLNAQFLYTEAVSKSSIKISLSLQVETPTGEKFERTCTVEYLVKFQECRLCWLMGPTRPWNFVVQLRPYATSNRQSLLNLEPRILRLAPIMGAVNLRKVGRGIDVFFAKEMCANSFVIIISRFAPIKKGKIHKTLSHHNSKNDTTSCQVCIPAFVFPICTTDLVFLPSKVSAKLGNLGPLVICTKAKRSITLLDPFTLCEFILGVDQYWNAPFEVLKTREELVEFMVLNVEIVSNGHNYSLADVEVARISDFGQNDLRFSVRSHLGNILKPGDVALGYVLYGANITDVEADKCRDLLPDVVLIEKKCEQPLMKPEKRNANPEYLEFLRGLEKNPEAMFNLSLKCGNNDDEKETAAMASVVTGTNAGFDLDNLLAGLGLSDGEDGDPIRKD